MVSISDKYPETINPFSERSELWYTAREFCGMITAHARHGRFFNERKAGALLDALVNAKPVTYRAEARHFAAAEIIRGIRSAAHKTPYKQFLNNNHKLLQFCDADCQALLSTIVGYRVHCHPQVFKKLADYKVTTPEMAESNRILLQKCLERSHEKNGEQKAVLYAPVWENFAANGAAAAPETLQKQDVLDVLLKYSVDCSKSAYQFFCDYDLKSGFERDGEKKIDRFLFEKDKEFWDARDVEQMSWVLEKRLQNNPRMGLDDFQKYSGAWLDLLHNKYYGSLISLRPLEQWMENRVSQHGGTALRELFSEQDELPETIDKNAFRFFLNQVIDKVKDRGGIKNCTAVFLAQTSAFFKDMVEKHSFSKKEMLEISRNFKVRNYHSDSTEAYFMDLNTELQGIYNRKLLQEVLALRQWARTQPAKNAAERLAVRSTYIDILHERLINDKSVRNVNLAEALAERQTRFYADTSGNFEKDKLKANRIVQAIAGVYRTKSFVKDIRATALYFDGGKPSKTLKLKQSVGR